MKIAFVAAAVLGLGIAQAVLDQGSAPATVRPYLWSAERPKSAVGEINVFRRFSAERAAAMREFYGEVLGLPVLPETALGGGQMIRYPVGRSEVKLFPVAASPANTAAPTDAAGVRLLTFFFADEAAITQRLAAHGLPAPRFERPASRPGATAAALVQDPTASGSSSSSCLERRPNGSRASRSASPRPISLRAARSTATSWVSPRNPRSATSCWVWCVIRIRTARRRSTSGPLAPARRKTPRPVACNTSSETSRRSTPSCGSAAPRSTARCRRRGRCARCGWRTPTASAITSRSSAATTTGPSISN